MLKYFTDINKAGIWPLISLLLFFAAFIVITLWAYRRRGAEHYDRMASMALDGQSQNEEELHHGGR